MYSLILHGRRSFELHKWRHLSVPVQNVTSFSSSFSSASASDVSSRGIRKGKNFTVSYLVDSLGLTTELAESISSKVNFTDKANPDSVLSLFRGYGFTDSQISTIFTSYPRLLIADAEKSLGPKLKYLQSRGASSSELTEIVSKVPEILARKGEKTISIYYDFVKEIIEADKSSKFQNLCDSLPEGNKQGNKIRNVLVLRELGVPQKFLFSLLISDAQPVCGKEKFEESLKKVVEMGFDPTSSKFVDALCIIYGWTDKAIEEKANACKSLGFVVEDVWAMFKKWPSFLKNSEKKIENSIETFLALGFSTDESEMLIKHFPQCVGYSVELVKKKTEFLVKKMNWPLRAVVSHPQVLSYSMEKRIVPRCNIIKALMAKGLLGNELPPITLLARTDQVFLQRYVRKHVDKQLVTELMAIFSGDHAS